MNSHTITKQALLILSILAITLPAQLLAQAASQPGDTGNPVPRVYGNDGILDCSGSPQNSVGWEQARGVFVPVSENAVAHNTNVLVYKECILDGIASKVSESMVAFMTKSTLNWANNTPDGEPAFVRNYKDFRDTISNKVVDDFVTGARTEGIFEPYREDIRETLAKSHARFTNTPEDVYRSTIPEDKEADVVNFLEGRGEFSWDTFLLTIQPQNNPVGALTLSLRQLLEDKTEKITDAYREVDQGQGFKPVKNCEQVPAGNGTYEEICNIVTPGSSIKDIVNYTLLTGQRQTENADELDELVGSLMSNIHTRIVTSAGGLRGITNSDYGISYLDQVVQDAAAGAQVAYTDVGLNFLARSIETERDYKSARESSFRILDAIIEQLKRKESACWTDIVTRAEIDIIDEAGATSATITNSTSAPVYNDQGEEIEPTEYDITITAGAGSIAVSYTLRRHTDNSKNVIEDSVLPLVTMVRESVKKSEKALLLLNNFQTMLTSSNTQGNTNFVLNEVNQLVQMGALHSPADVSEARTQYEETITFVEGLYTQVEEQWDGGWCDPENWRGHIKN